ncbi:hypothetical protein BT93_D0156 [Corymbia citriodora subsp. variegata]|nr:hypothetical protein BT93_D0156 [Corymbia citriodora subsp. variegata]
MILSFPPPCTATARPPLAISLSTPSSLPLPSLPFLGPFSRSLEAPPFPRRPFLVSLFLPVSRTSRRSSSPFTGMSTSQVSSGLPEGDPDAPAAEARPSSDSSETAPPEDGTKPDGRDPVAIELPALVIKLPSNNAGQEVKVDGDDDEEDEEGGFKTPTSADSKIPPLAECPPAPRKRRAEEILNSKTPLRALAKCRRVLLDLSSEIQSSFAPPPSTNFSGMTKRRPEEEDAAPARQV